MDTVTIMSRTSAKTRGADRRIRKNRAALRSAFNELMLAKGYEAIRAMEVAERADVGRSTLYLHFNGKADILAESLTGVLSALADACVQERLSARLLAVTEHFWQNRNVARSALSGPARDVVAKRLTELTEQRLSLPSGRNARTALLARSLAHGQLGMLEAWLSGRYGLSAGAVARMLHSFSCAAAAAVT